MTSLNDLRAQIEAIKINIRQTLDLQEKCNLAALGLELNAMYLQACGLINAPAGSRESLRDRDLQRAVLIIDEVVAPINRLDRRLVKVSKVLLRRRSNGKRYVK